MRNEYYGVTRTDEYLEHWGLSFKGGTTRKGHKYIARIQIGNGKWRYIYTPAEYAAYLRGKVGGAINKIRGKSTTNDRSQLRTSKNISEGITQSRSRKARTAGEKAAPTNYRENTSQHRKKSGSYTAYDARSKSWRRSTDGETPTTNAQRRTVRKRLGGLIPIPFTKKVVTPFDRTPQKETKRKSKRSRK